MKDGAVFITADGPARGGRLPYGGRLSPGAAAISVFPHSRSVRCQVRYVITTGLLI